MLRAIDKYCMSSSCGEFYCDKVFIIFHNFKKGNTELIFNAGKKNHKYTQNPMALLINCY